VFRVLATLKQQGYVQQAPGTDAYQLTDRVALWSRNKLEDSLRQTSRPFLGRLLARFEQTVNLAMFDAGQIRYVEILEGLRSIRAAPNVHAVAPLHCTALGKVVLAFLPAPEARERLEANAPLQKYTNHTITSLRVLSKELTRIRKQGFAVDNEETEEGARCVAAPIFGPKEKPLAGISISGPISSIRGNVIQEVAQALKQCTRGISSQLGYLP
jgi:DNA-binding IclR family transcriptional regulator